MKSNKYGEIIYSQNDVSDLLMQGQDLACFEGMFVEGLKLEDMAHILDHVPAFVEYDKMCQENLTTEAWDHRNQTTWFMPQDYQDLDIAELVLSLCHTQEELQRVGQELMLYQERDLFNLLRYLKYLVDTMTQNQCIWGVGRGSSVASYVLYLLGIHRINSMYYELDISEFLR